jgi:hypothetical protein
VRLNGGTTGSLQTIGSVQWHVEHISSTRGTSLARDDTAASASNSMTKLAPLQTLAQQAQLRNNHVIMQQLRLLNVHSDAITDLQLTEVPQPMLISADRSGAIKVFL